MSEAVLVIGGGPNGLAAACLLARAGRTVTVLEARDTLGGRAAGEEFHPGYRHTGILHDTETVRPWVIRELGLGAHGLEVREPPTVTVAGREGSSTIPSSGIPGEAGALVGRVAPFARGLMDAAPPDLGADASLLALVKPALGFRRLGERDMMELLRIGPAPVDDWLAETIEDRRLRAGLALRGLLGTWMGPRSPSSTATLLLHQVMAGDEVAGGPAALVAALLAACAAAGVTLRTRAAVERIRLDGGRVAGVTLADGTALDAACVLSTIGPRRTLLDLVDARVVPPLVEAEAHKIRTRGIVAKLHLALSGPLSLADGSTPERLVVADGPLDVERAFDDAKHRRLPRRPVLDVRVPSLSTPGLAPDGHHVASVQVFGACHALEGGWTDTARQGLEDAVLTRLREVAPDLQQRVVASELLTPADLEGRLGLDGGHLCHAELGLDQLHAFRPTPLLARYATPIPGLFLGSPGCHPATGGLTVGAGPLAARTILG